MIAIGVVGPSANASEMFVKEIPVMNEPNEELPLLNEDEKLRLQAEEIYRNEVKSLDSSAKTSRILESQAMVFS